MEDRGGDEGALEAKENVIDTHDSIIKKHVTEVKAKI